ncbi:DUF72 domain-containing protein [Mucilaginibacter corticis]|uniref:DUF72 domain-containing protein n=1 Tax=Mucilaginibacter corticis TaxID=2597670 RepID=A0A556MX66_9SPHI|nr:DUF72 domain-containing protein [Mucilaginibacter corticis]TSJ44408.1 DUF72 domain-containing protein [Mucilaginibacter corticis]
MEFGHIEDLDTVDFTLPPDSQGTISTLKSAGTGEKLQIYVGASKWGEKSWTGKIYPPKTPDKEFLPLYCQNFNAVEFGATFYTNYTADDMSRWIRHVADAPDFKFCPRMPQQISHIRRLVNAEERTAQFYQSLSVFGNHLGPLILQLGENFSPKLFPNLQSYLPGLPRTIPVHVEVRNKKWFVEGEDRDNYFNLLRELGVGTVISDTAGRRDAVHMELTRDEVLIRFVGNNLAPSDYTRMDAWVERFKDWQALGLKKIWFFMHQNDERYVPEACDYLIKRLNEKLGTQVARPKFLNQTLF